MFSSLANNRRSVYSAGRGSHFCPAFGAGTSRNVSQGEKNLAKLSSNAKADGIRIITLAFDLDDTTTRARLKACASDAKSFFIANDDTDLSAAFEEIKTAVASEIYLKK